MPKAVVALFETRAEAERAAEDLIDAGFAPGEVEIRSGEARSSHESGSRSWWDWLFARSRAASRATHELQRIARDRDKGIGTHVDGASLSVKGEAAYYVLER